jgi:hypothetical protein
MASHPSPQGTQSAPGTRNPPAQSALNGPASVTRELLILGIALACGFTVIPLLIWAVGNRILGPYVHTQDPTAGTGPMRLIADFFVGLAHGSIVFWCVAVGPYILLTVMRTLYAYLRPSPTTTSASRG